MNFEPRTVKREPVNPVNLAREAEKKGGQPFGRPLLFIEPCASLERLQYDEPLTRRTAQVTFPKLSFVLLIVVKPYWSHTCLACRNSIRNAVDVDLQSANLEVDVRVRMVVTHSWLTGKPDTTNLLAGMRSS